MSIHKDIFHLEQFMYSYTFWIVNEIFYICWISRHASSSSLSTSSLSVELYQYNLYFILYFFSLDHFFFFPAVYNFFYPTYLPAMSSTSKIKYRFLYSLNIKRTEKSFPSFPFSRCCCCPFFSSSLCTCRPLMPSIFCLVLRNHHHSPPQKKHTYNK